jgi:DNA mismatch endonuclease (patch repair protein)
MDTVSRRDRSRIMSRMKSSGSGPELVLRRVVKELVDYRVLYNVKSLPGTPDLVIPKLRLAVFVDGCYFHGCPEHHRPPKSNVRFWKAKMAATIRHDFEVRLELRSRDWTVWVIWEHEVKDEKALRKNLKRRFEKLIRDSEDPPPDQVA